MIWGSLFNLTRDFILMPLFMIGKMMLLGISLAFNGHFVTGQRMVTWNLLCFLASASSLPWFVAGDFNEILSNQEKVGGLVRPAIQFARFREAIQDCSLLESPVLGSQYTWQRKIGQEVVLERIDRGFSTQSWLDLYPSSVEKHLITSSSDHLALLFVVRKMESRFYSTQPSFKFENYWTRYAGCEQVITAHWQSCPCPNIQAIAGLILSCGSSLSIWSKEVVGRLAHNISAKQKQTEIQLCRVSYGDLSPLDDIESD
ncbi:hypothetical protein PTKIN_Ptkin08bG0075900 [Pterospermum kingtungense]